VEKKENVRELVTDMVVEITAGREKSHILIRNVLDKYNYLPGYDKSFIKKVTEGTLERMITIDYVINQFSKVPVNKMKPFIRSLMRMSVYQILYLDKVPDSAVCNEAVKLATKRGFGPLKGFVNGVLRNIARGKDSVVFPNKDAELIKALSIQYSMPESLVKLLLSQYGNEQTEEILNGYLVERPVCIRLSETLTAEEKELVIKGWETLGIEAKVHPWLSYAYELTLSGSVKDDVNFTNGFYTVQDLSSMLVGEIAGFKSDDYVIDVCSAPGGKALHACTKVSQGGVVDARDVSDSKVDLILENKTRMRADNLKVKVWDARIRDEEVIHKADVVLLDIPCSGLGVMGRKPEIKYRLEQDSFADLDSLQKEIVNTVCEYVKPGGTLVYSTCTLRKEENEEIVEKFLECNPEFTKIDFSVGNLASEDGMLTLIPNVHNTDGFFMAKLKKIK
jgi:16S rRNA (cytosine967-C5)-methyltransferase